MIAPSESPWEFHNQSVTAGFRKHLAFSWHTESNKLKFHSFHFTASSTTVRETQKVGVHHFGIQDFVQKNSHNKYVLSISFYYGWSGIPVMIMFHM